MQAINLMTPIAWIGIATMAVACGTQGEANQTTASSKNQLAQSMTAGNGNQTDSLDSNQTLGLQDILPALHLMPREAAWGASLQCDPNAQRTTQQVCGKPVPLSIVAQWDNCTAPMGPPHGHFHGDRAGGPPPGFPPPPDGGMGMGMPPPQDGNGTMPSPPFHGGGHGGGVSSGSLTLNASVNLDPNAACDANTVIGSHRQATYTVQMSDPNGVRPTVVLSGTNSEDVSHISVSWAENANLTLNSNRTVTDSSGAVTAVALRGNVTVQMSGPSANQPPQRTVNGTLSVLNGTASAADTVVLTNVVEGPPHSCPWPVSGTVQRTFAAGGSHTLVFTSTCGQASLDGTAVTLPFPHHPHHGP